MTKQPVDESAKKAREFYRTYNNMLKDASKVFEEIKIHPISNAIEIMTSNMDNINEMVDIFFDHHNIVSSYTNRYGNQHEEYDNINSYKFEAIDNLIDRLEIICSNPNYFD